MFGLRQGEKYNSYEEVEIKFAHDANWSLTVDANCENC